MKRKIGIKINGKKYSLAPDQTILTAARDNGIFIPSLCHHPDLEIKANCQVCLVEIKGSNCLRPACSTAIWDGMEISTTSPRLERIRRTNLELLFSAHAEKCSSCTLLYECPLLALAKRYGLNINKYPDRKLKRAVYKFNHSVEVDGSQCFDCQNCVEVCAQQQKISYLEIAGQGSRREIVPTANEKIDCIYCGQCTVHCPVASAQEQSSVAAVEEILKNKQGRTLVAILAPSARVSVGEDFSQSYGQDSSLKVIGALKRLGFDQVLDVGFAADTTALTEAEELLERLSSSSGRRPLITSCCPAWVKYVEFYRPDLIANLTTSRSPQIQLGGIIKTYWARKKKIDPAKIVVVSIMPCTAKKFEITRPELKIGRLYPVDQVLTVRELSYLIKKNNIDFKSLPKLNSDSLIKRASGGGLIFGASGGVMESALRTASRILNPGQSRTPRPEFKKVRGSAGVRTACFNLSGRKLKVAVVNGIGHIAEVLENIESYDYLEVMACPGGCLGGGGQPIPSSKEIVAKRTAGLYRIDDRSPLKTAKDNIEALRVLKWLKAEGLADQVLETSYSRKYKEKK